MFEDSLNPFYLCFQITYLDFDFQLFLDELELIEADHGYPPRFILWCTNASNSANSFTTTLTLQLSNELNTDIEKYNFHFSTGTQLGEQLDVCIHRKLL